MIDCFDLLYYYDYLQLNLNPSLLIFRIFTRIVLDMRFDGVF